MDARPSGSSAPSRSSRRTCSGLAVDVAFSRFDRTAGCHRECPPPSCSGCSHARAAAYAADPADAADPHATADETPAVVERRLRAATASAVRRGISALPDGSRSDAALVVQSAIGMVKGLYWLSRRFGRSVLGRPADPRTIPIDVQAAASHAVDAMPLGPEDVYVSMGLDWEYNDLETLARARRRQGFRTILFCYDVIPVRHPASHVVRRAADVREVLRRRRARRRPRRRDLRGDARRLRRRSSRRGAPVPPISVVHLGTDLVTGARGVARPRGRTSRRGRSCSASARSNRGRTTSCSTTCGTAPRGAARRPRAAARARRHGRLGCIGPAVARAAQPPRRRQDRDPRQRRRRGARVAVRALPLHGLSVLRRRMGAAGGREPGAGHAVHRVERARRRRGDAGPRADARSARLPRLARARRPLGIRPGGAPGGRRAAARLPAAVVGGTGRR